MLAAAVVRRLRSNRRTVSVAISVVVCTHNRAARLRTMLTSLLAATSPVGGWEVVVVDNNSSDSTAAVIEDLCRRAPVPVRRAFEPRLGLNAARNTGVEHATAPLLAFTDDDVTVEPEWLREVVRVFNRFDCLGVGGRIVPVWPGPEPEWHRQQGRYPLMAVIVAFDHGSEVLPLRTPPFGANMAFRRQAFERYGAFRPDLDRAGGGLLSGGDTEFGRRVLAAGETIMYAPAAVVWHPVEPHRATTRYFRRWYFGYGRSQARQTPAPRARWLPVPPYLLRGLAVAGVRSVIDRTPAARLYYRLAACQVSGEIIETFRLARRR